MRRFHSYGPVDGKRHFCVERRDLIEECLTQLIDDPVSDEIKGGYYFTIWAPRQTGKTWLMEQVTQEIPQRYGDKFAVFSFSLGNLRGMTDDEVQAVASQTVPEALSLILKGDLPGHPQIEKWEDFRQLFAKENGLWDRPLILLIDEVDTAPPMLLDLIVGRFRELYLHRQTNWLHGLALIGVRAVLGLDSPRGSPFNIQHALHIPNLTQAEVEDMYQQYQMESGQKIVPAVVEAVYKNTRGQPGLVSWFGELLTKRDNQAQEKVIDLRAWENVYESALHTEFNNTVLNIIKKARTIYKPYVLELFARSNVKFSLDADWCNYMYMHGLIDQEKVLSEQGIFITVCRFSSPFIQYRVYNALTYDLFDQFSPLLALNPLDELTDVFVGDTLNLPTLLERYKDYLARLKARGINPWKEQPRRKTDVHLTEAVGHFHLYAWLKDALGLRCIVSPEFPTGNGKVDLHLRCSDKAGLIEVKSFKDRYQLKADRSQAARYAKSMGLDRVTMAVFVPTEDETILEQLSEGVVIDNVQVNVVAIGWV